MSNDRDFEGFAEAIRAVARDLNALVLGAYLDVSERGAVPQAALDLDELVGVARHIKPRLIYLVESSFEFESETEALRETASADEEVEDQDGANEAAIEKLAKKWRKHEGKPCLAIAAIVVDGVLLTSVSRPQWREEFDAELEALEEEIATARDEERFALSRQDSAEVREKAIVLADHPSFNTGRTSFEKRAFLAEQLFPDLKPEQRQAITRRAENIDWLNKTGLKT